MQACDRCHARKIKCDRRSPRCSVCEKAGADCFHTDRTQQRKIPRGYVQSLEDKVRTLQERNAQLQQELESSSLSTTPQPTPSSQVGNGRHVESSGGANDSVPTGSELELLDSPRSAGVHQRQSLNHDPATGEDNDSPGFSKERPYLGSSTNVDFVKVVQSVVNASNFRGGFLAPSSTRESPPPAPPALPTDSSIPPREVAQPLIDAYFAHWHITFPLLHRSTFMATVDHIYADDAYYESEVFNAFVFDILLAMGSVSRNRHEWSSLTTESHFARAMTKLDRVLRLPGIMPLQALVLCCQYGVFSTLRDTSTDTWHLLGLAARFCTDLGLHRHHGNRHLDVTSSSSDAETYKDAEMARRCFWCFYNLDRVVSQTLGRPVALRDEDIDTHLPMMFDSDCCESEHWHRAPQSQSESSEESWTCPFIQLIALRKISGKIHQNLYVNASLKRMSLSEKIKMREDLQQQLDSWKDSVSHLGLSPSRTTACPTSSFLSRDWYEVIYDNAAIVLYRPSPLFPYRHPQNDAQDEDVILRKLLDFSGSSIANYAGLLQQRKLNYSWITLYAVFMAGLSYLYSVSRLAKRKKQGLSAESPSYLAVINNTRLCSNILVAICERWDEARRSCSIFERLSSAAIQEVVTATFQMTETRNITPIRNDNRSSYSAPNSGPVPYMFSQTPAAAAVTATTMSASYVAHPGSIDNLGDFALTDPPPYGMDDFQIYFQQLRNSVFRDSAYESNEVVLGFDQEWFGGASPDLAPGYMGFNTP